ncbi:RsbRD N-terminal domain-containing protein [Microcoleus sp. OTE_8_concoct_300]|uniref:RsbRD N-terminal domain-containing protein n=1 Tax=Microcoleus sp. OTE_8_concoct_300 TaxID=2964710 RepID=UPI00403F389E
MELTSNNTIAEILERHKAQLLADWLKELQNTGLRPDDLMRAKELLSECQEFLQLLHIAVGHGNFSDIQTPEWENMRVLLASVSRERVQRGFTPERDSEFHFMLQKAIVRSALSRTHTKPRRTCRTTLAFHQFIRPARSLGDRNLSQSLRRSHRTPAARNARIVNTSSQNLARNSRFISIPVAWE